jgi:mediator of RNA polymerase II transcription subunit 5
MNGEASGDTGLEVAALQLEAVMDLPTINNRAGLYVFLNSMVCVGHVVFYPPLTMHS